MKMRSLLFVPADSPRKFAKALDVGTDAIIVDLEDSVAEAAKDGARDTLATTIATAAGGKSPAIWVRVNGFDSGRTQEDVTAAVRSGAIGIMLPKCQSGGDVESLAKFIDEAELSCGAETGLVKILALVTETPRAIFNMGTYTPAHPRLAALTWGAEDLSATIGSKTNTDHTGSWTAPYQMVRSMCLIAAADAGIPAIDTVATDFSDHEGLIATCAEASRDGFMGKLAIHPSQIDPINQSFTPSEEEIEKARKIVSAFEDTPSIGTIAIDGKMYDQPHLDLARRILKSV